MNQAAKTEAAKEKYDDSVQQKKTPDEQKRLHDAQVWEQTKYHALALATTVLP